ncbi:MAG TPA: hypothetical protein VMY34_01320 [Acidimicrobiales bacterium]|nr:hypothetical protein [Acidimicrobiales bacterium]
MTDDRAKSDDDHDTAARAPGASGPGDPGYDGEVNLGEEGANPSPSPSTPEAEPGTDD